MKITKVLGLTVPPSLLVRADEVILPQPPSCRWRHLAADYPRWLNGETAFTLRNSGSSSSEISRMLARAVDNGMPAQWVRTMM